MSNEAARQNNESVAPPRFTLTVQRDGNSESDRLAHAIERAARGGNGPDLICLVPPASERRDAGEITLRCRGTLLALPDAVGCVLGETLVTLPARGELMRLHEQIAHAQNALNAQSAQNAQSALSNGQDAAMANLDSPLYAPLYAPEWVGMGDGVAASEVLAASEGAALSEWTREEAATETMLLELRSRIARLEGALVGQLMARLDDRLSRVATREEVAEIAANVTSTLTALTAITTLVEQHQQDEGHRQQEQQAWQGMMVEEMRSYRHQVEALAHDNELLKAQLTRRWWQVWQTRKM